MENGVVYVINGTIQRLIPKSKRKLKHSEKSLLENG